MELTETKQKLMDIAEQLFAEKGIDATSVRDIITKAGVNLAAVHYHFGSKEALIRDVFARRIEPVNKERLRQLDQLIADKNTDTFTVEKIIEAFLEPALHIGLSDKNRRQLILKLMAKAHSESREIREMIFGQFEEVMLRFVAALQIALPHLSNKEITLRFIFMVGAMFMTMTGKPEVDKMLAAEGNAPIFEDILRSMIPFLAAGFRAPVSEIVNNGDNK